jgi:hypothetical protein
MTTIRTLIIITILTFGQLAVGQTIKTIKPELVGSNDYTKAEEIAWQKALDQYFKINSGDLDYEKLTEPDKKMVDSLEMIEGPMTQGVGCSWYCGGGPYKVTSSSYLKEQGKSTYLPDNLHDFDLFTAWVPDTKDRVIGKKVNFHFKPFSPRVNQVTIYNGYIKNKELWQANSRAKKLKLYINNKPYANLELQDVTASQSFKIDPIQSTDSTKDLVLTFEVIEIYKGTKYGDLAISEINFDGLDVHCFAAGTSILMADKTEKNIELIKSGDSILTFDKQTNQLSKTVVIRLVTARHSNLVKLTFDDREIIVTDDHPFFTDNKQWASVNSDKSNNFYLQDKLVSQLSVDMNVFIPSDNKFIRLKSIEHLAGEQLTYTIEIASGDSFIANGLLVKTENVKWTN